MHARPTALLIGDAALRHDLAACAEDLDVQCVEAELGQEALIRAERVRPSLVLAEQALPDMTGWDLCDMLRAQDSGAAAWFIMVLTSAPAAPLDVLPHGPDDFLTRDRLRFELPHKVLVARRVLELRRKAARLARQLDAEKQARAAQEEGLSRVTAELVEMAAQLQAEICRNQELEVDHVRAARADTVIQAATSLRHEVNNPLCAILVSLEGAMKALDELPVASPELTAHLTRIRRGAERVQEVVAALSAPLAPEPKDYVAGIRMLDLRLVEGGAHSGTGPEESSPVGAAADERAA